jgi:hypothetical protein
MGFESTLGWKLLYREELREDPVIDAHRCTAVVAIHVHIIVTHHGQSFKAPLAYQTCTREASAGHPDSMSLYERESLAAEAKLAAERKIRKRPKPSSNSK